MHLVPVALIAILALLVIAGGYLFQSRACKPASSASSVTVQHMESLSKSRQDSLLADLRKSKTPNPPMGAMCYKPAPVARRAEYLCPICGERTLYVSGQADYIAYDLEECRRIIDELRRSYDGAVKLDERNLCKKCSPNAHSVALSLIITRGDGKEHTTTPVSMHDLRMLLDFLKGKRPNSTLNRGKQPPETKTARLRELLGLAQDTTVKK